MSAPRPTHPAVAALAQLAEWPELREPIADCREAMTSLRWHQALRRRIPEASAESRARGAQASGELEGVRLPVDIVREYLAGVRPWPAEPNPIETVIKSVLAATAASEEVVPRVLQAPAQALARLHTAAAAGRIPPEQVGRPRTTDDVCEELVDIGPLPSAHETEQRLAMLAEILRGHAEAPAVVIAAIVHAEVATVRPFTVGNGIVARALERAVVQASGLDPTGVAVTELGHFRQGLAPYVGALTAYATGTRDGVRLWMEHCCTAMLSAALEGHAVADAVLAGRLPT
ncbi:MAG: Fic family protein [Actinomycetia bacterium]|nr:Fic family protein [Actinomycetes bacterium]